MAGGSWNGGGQTPAHPCAWIKMQQGWINAITPNTNGTANIQAVETGRTVYKLWKDGLPGTEYFLVENRQKTLFDRSLPGDGLLIWHVDEAITTNSDENHPKVALEQADGRKGLENARNRGDSGDPYPGSAGNRTFSYTSAPSSKSYGNVDTFVSVKNIPNSGPTMKVDYAVKVSIVKPKPEKDTTLDKSPKETKDMHDWKPILDNPPKNYIKDIIDTCHLVPSKSTSENTTNLSTDRGENSGYSLEQRVAILEAKLAGIEPFINSPLRPNLRKAAISPEQP